MYVCVFQRMWKHFRRPERVCVLRHTRMYVWALKMKLLYFTWWQSEPFNVLLYDLGPFKGLPENLDLEKIAVTVRNGNCLWCFCCCFLLLFLLLLLFSLLPSVLLPLFHFREAPLIGRMFFALWRLYCENNNWFLFPVSVAFSRGEKSTLFARWLQGFFTFPRKVSNLLCVPSFRCA